MFGGALGFVIRALHRHDQANVRSRTVILGGEHRIPGTMPDACKRIPALGYVRRQGLGPRPRRQAGPEIAPS